MTCNSVTRSNMSKIVIVLSLCFLPLSAFSAPVARIWVAKSDGALQCGEGQPVSLKKMSGELKRNGVRVFKQKKIHDGVQRIQVCGAEKGDLNTYQIEKKMLAKAKLLGFSVLPGGLQ